MKTLAWPAIAALACVACSASKVKVYKAEILADKFDKDHAPDRFVLDENGKPVVLSYHRILSPLDKKLLLERKDSWITELDRFRGGLVFSQSGALFSLSSGRLEMLLETGLNELTLATDSDCVYFSGKIPKGSDEYRIFAFSPERGVAELCSMPERPRALACGRGRLFFSVGPLIYSVDMKGRSRSEAVLPGSTEINALAFDENEQILYFSRGEGVSALDYASGRLVLIFLHWGGVVDIRFVNGDLFVLTRYPERIVALRQISKVLRTQEANALPWD